MIEHVTGHGQRPDRGGGYHHQPHHHRVLLPPLRGLRVVPGPLQQQYGELKLDMLFLSVKIEQM